MQEQFCFLYYLLFFFLDRPIIFQLYPVKAEPCVTYNQTVFSPYYLLLLTDSLLQYKDLHPGQVQRKACG